MTLLTIAAARVRLHELSLESARDLNADSGSGGFAWLDGDAPDGTRTGSGITVKAHAAGTYREGWGTYAIVRTEDGRAVGGIGFHSAPDEEGRVEIGYDVTQGARGRGYATEAVRAIAAWALSQPAVTAVTANTDLDNGPSQRVLERAGFVRIPTTEDLCAYELLGI
ncbi:GNAT family N-acetyltransferase [Streptomyces sp. NBC_01003]|uniref:GNAT family N-acetyltransferase n=1 Tax=Streptomyces sp. NBC_01003 TaxID=2903714 RepID=UPI003870E886|nr:GNAT family N-acetyltransferase [Streptomyces sp. NBC_01003]